MKSFCGNDLEFGDEVAWSKRLPGHDACLFHATVVGVAKNTVRLEYKVPGRVGSQYSYAFPSDVVILNIPETPVSSDPDAF